MSEALLRKFLPRLIRRGTFEIHLANGNVLQSGTAEAGYPDVSVRFNDARVPRDVMLDPRLGMAEAFMDGRVELLRGDIMDMVSLVRMNSPWDHGRNLIAPTWRKRLTSRLTALAKSFNAPGSSRRNVAHHYDIGNDLYRLMLDADHMQYSCAYWDEDRFGPGMTLDQAQEAKLAHIAAKLALQPGQRVLDIGCGWGGMAIFLASRADVQVHGITLSQEQLALAQQRAEAAGVADRITFELVDYRDLAARGEQYDRIVSVGMFEHVGRPQFETFFRACANLLVHEGVMLLHTIGRMGGPGTTDAFTNKYVFPGGYIPALSETVAASEKVRLIATDIETLRLHYARTIREWYARCVANKAQIVALYDERFFRMWTFYLAGAATVFESGSMCNYQIQYTRSRHALPLTRNYLEQAEKELLKSKVTPDLK